MKHYKLWSYLITFIIGIALFFILAAFFGLFSAETYERVIVIICDSLFIPGVLFTSVGIIGVIAGDGFFDTLAYGFRTFFLFLPLIVRRGQHEKYRDYVERRRQERKDNPKSMLFLIVVGVVFIGLSGLCFLVDYIVK